MRRSWWIGLALVGMAWACSEGTPPQHAQQPPPHPYVQPAQPAGPTATVGAAGPTPAATTMDPGRPVLPAPAVDSTSKPTVPAPATPYDKPATQPTGPTTTTPAPATPFDPPGKVPPAGTATTAPPPPPTGGAGDNPDGKPAGSPCSMAKECQSNICEGQGCGYNAGSCAPTNRRCTRDLVAYCSCSGQTFGASGTCPGRIYRHKGVCKQ